VSIYENLLPEKEPQASNWVSIILWMNYNDVFTRIRKEYYLLVKVQKKCMTQNSIQLSGLCFF
jgi:hypothetical protein